jgi:2,3-bisphosphoglycerate-independent phosphoglycerate mutase
MMPGSSPAPGEGRIPVALLVLDGLGDRPHPDTGGRSPVEAAATPNLDRLVRAGRMGDVVVVGPGIAPESDAGVFALLGYDPVHDSPGRGVLEALGVGIPLEPGDVALRLNFATADGEGTIVDSRVGRSLSTGESQQLARALTEADLLADEGIRAEVRATVGHRGVLWLHPTRGGPLSPNVSNSDPFYEKVGGMGRARTPDVPRVRAVEPLEATASATRTARSVDLFLSRAAERLAGHAVNARRALAGKRIGNVLLVRNAGSLPDPPPARFSEKHGFAGAALTEMPVERGIARVLGLEDRYVGPMGPDRDAGYRERAQIAAELLGQFPFVYVHLKGPDEPGHDGDARLKQEIVEAIDRSFFGPLLEQIDLARVRLGVTADHATPAVLRGHSDDPVPLLLVGAGVEPDPTAAAATFSEATAARGDLGRVRGADVLRLLEAPSPVASR